MKNVKKSEFSFEGLYIKESHINRNVENHEGEYSFEITPFGSVIKENRIFKLELIVNLEDDTKSFSAKIHAVATFSFNTVITPELLDNYFYVNAPAIVFPYIRAYITSLTSLMGNNPIILPLLNLTNLKNTLKDNTNFQ